MTTPTAKQVALAAKLFNRHADISKRHGCPKNVVDYRADMIQSDLNPDDRRDVSAYIGFFMTSRAEAQMTMRRF